MKGIKTFFLRVIMLLILVTFSPDCVLILFGENWCWSLLGLNGLMIPLNHTLTFRFLLIVLFICNRQIKISVCMHQKFIKHKFSYLSILQKALLKNTTSFFFWIIRSKSDTNLKKRIQCYLNNNSSLMNHDFKVGA